MGKKIDIHLSESAKAKQQCHSLPYSVLRIGNDQCKHFKCVALPLTATPKGVIQKMGNKIDTNLSESAKAKKQCHSLPYSVLRIWNGKCKNFKCGFTPDSNPKMGQKG